MPAGRRRQLRARPALERQSIEMPLERRLLARRQQKALLVVGERDVRDFPLPRRELCGAAACGER